MPERSVDRRQIHAPQPLDAPFGRILYAGTKWESQATYGHAQPPDFFRPTHNYLLVYTLEGEADYVDRTGLRTILRPGSLTWTIPEVEQSYGPRPGTSWSEFFLWVAGPVFDLWQARGVPGPTSRHLRLLPVDFWFKRFVGLIENRERESEQVRICRFQTLLAEALQHDQEAREQGDEWCRNACRLLAEGTLASPQLEEVAEAVNMSYPLFRKRFSEAMGQSPGAYRFSQILRRACSALVKSDQTVSQIAAQLAFHDPFHFSHRFKQATGLSPTDFRRQAQR